MAGETTGRRAAAPSEFHLDDRLSELCMEALREAGLRDEFRRVDLEDEPPLRVLEHGLFGEGITADASGLAPAPYPSMLLRNGKWFHAFRYDSDCCDSVLHQCDWGRERFGDGDKAGDAYFRHVLAFESQGISTTTADRFVQALVEALAPHASAAFDMDSSTADALHRSRCYSVYANALLPGHVINLHLDVPEFRGLNRSSCPNWLLVAAHCSGLFEQYRVYNSTCIFYPCDASGGQLAVYRPVEGKDAHINEPIDRLWSTGSSMGKVYEVKKGSALVLDADSCFHHSAQARSSTHARTACPQLPVGCKLISKAPKNKGDSWEWCVVHPETGKVSSFLETDLRWTISCKFHVATPNVTSDSLHSAEIISALAEELIRRGRLPPATDPKTMPLADLAPMFVKEFIVPKAPTMDVVRSVWQGN